MEYLESYKSLDKLCREIYGEEGGISAYIDDMCATPDGAYRVQGWNDTLKKLKYCRHIRNIIVHQPGAKEEQMCSFEDATWLDDFHARIMSGKDPLSLYRRQTEAKEQMRRARSQTQSAQHKSDISESYKHELNVRRRRPILPRVLSFLRYVIIALIILLVIFCKDL